MFERFTEGARRTVVLAQEEARDLLHNYIGTEHILLGLLRKEDGLAAKALQAAGVSLEEVRRRVEEIIGRGEGHSSGHIPFTPRAKRTLELALREALQMSHQSVATDHILLGILREGEGVAAQVLSAMGVTRHSMRVEVLRIRSEGGTEEAEDEAEVPLRASRAEGFTRYQAEPHPTCPKCEAGVDGAAVSRAIDVPAEEQGETRRAVFVYCRQCGATLGTLDAG